MSLEALATRLRQLALAYPETYEESPWGDRVVKVKGKIFFSCGVHDNKLHLSAKLQRSGKKLLERPYAAPTHYGMGKHGWVTCTFAVERAVPVAEIAAWIRESFEAIAPKKLLAGARAPSPPKPKPKRTRKTAAKATLVCNDRLRAERAVQALAERGVALEVVATVGEVALKKTKALIVDIGRNPIDGIAFAERVDASDVAAHLFVTGVRDAAQAKQLRALGSAESFRAPPGDAKVADAVARALTASSP